MFGKRAKTCYNLYFILKDIFFQNKCIHLLFKYFLSQIFASVSRYWYWEYVSLIATKYFIRKTSKYVVFIYVFFFYTIIVSYNNNYMRFQWVPNLFITFLVCTISRANHTRRTSRSFSRSIASYSECQHANTGYWPSFQFLFFR